MPRGINPNVAEACADACDEARVAGQCERPGKAYFRNQTYRYQLGLIGEVEAARP